MSEKLSEDEFDRDNLGRFRTGVDTDRNDDRQEGRLHKRSEGYSGDGENESIPIEEAESESRDEEEL
jgi:hypothetical protein